VMSPTNAGLPPSLHRLHRLSFHGCTTLSSSVFETLLPRLPSLTHLDVSRTTITDSALASIPHSARLSHLNLSRCLRLSGSAVVQFLTTHPAATSLIYLNLLYDHSRYRLLTSADLHSLLPRLPHTLRSLTLNGAQLNSAHLPHLIPLTKHLEELGLGAADLSINELSSLVVPSPASTDSEHDDNSWTPHSLRYLDASGISAVQAGSLLNTRANGLLRAESAPLEVVEVGERVISGLGGKVGRTGWVTREFGRRAWVVRSSDSGRGERAWKMGAAFWGMRKVPVADAEVGGFYGHYMFKLL
jgi:hypothetical protein